MLHKDVRGANLDGIAATAQLAQSAPHVKILILTTFEQDDYIFGGLRAGASGFLLKRTRPEELIAAVRTIAAGDSLLFPVGHPARHRSHGPATAARPCRPGQTLRAHPA